jgi:hypothetical protein
MNIQSMLQFGRDYSQNWIIVSVLVSLIVSLALRTIPITLGLDLLWLYYLPFWLAIEVGLIYLFAVYGWIGLVISAAVDFLIRPGMYVPPSLLWFSDVAMLTLVILLIAIRGMPTEFEEVGKNLVILAIIYGILLFVIFRLSNLAMSEQGWYQFGFSIPGSIFFASFVGTICVELFDDHLAGYVAPIRIPYNATSSTPERRHDRPRETVGERRRVRDTATPVGRRSESRRRGMDADTRRSRRRVPRPNIHSEDIVYVCRNCGRPSPPDRCLHCGHYMDDG